MLTYSEQILQNLCHLCLARQFDAAHQLVSQVVQGISKGDTVTQGVLPSDIEKMRAVWQAFDNYGRVMNPNIDKGENDALRAAENFGLIIPYAHPQEQIFLKYCQARCYRYVPVSDDEKDNSVRYHLYREVMENYPVSEDKRDSFVKKWVREIIDLDISLVDRYEALCSAQKRSSDYGRYAYQSDLRALSEEYFSLKLGKAKRKDVPLEDRVLAAKQAKESVCHIDLSREVLISCQDDPKKLQQLRDLKKHRYTLVALGCLKNVYKEHGCRADVKAVSLQIGKEQNIFYKKYPGLKIKGGRGGKGD